MFAVRKSISFPCRNCNYYGVVNCESSLNISHSSKVNVNCRRTFDDLCHLHLFIILMTKAYNS